MAKQFLLIIGFLFSIQLIAQTGIGTATPNASAKLDVSSTDKGFLPPRVTLTAANTFSPIVGTSSTATGLLVYNLGSVGLQAGYYYWNGANWATIATASSAGNGVAASDMVKIYSEAYSTASNKLSNASGFSFTVPVSGRYLFDFSSTTYGANATTTFKVRQGTTDLGTDVQTSLNNNVHVEYNGKVEVNLQSGTTYNVALTTNATRDIYDFDRVYMKQVSGNLPVTGQSVDYVSVSTIYQTSIGDNKDLIFTSNNGGNIPYNTSTGVFTLSANKTYLFQAQVRTNTPSVNSSYIDYGFVDATTNAMLVNGTSTITSSTTATAGYGSNPVINFIYTPTTNQTVKLRTIAGTNGTQSVVSGTANITQIGSSAIINPWTLSGTNTFNTTGNVGIGTSTPSEKLDVSGNVKATNFIGNGSQITGVPTNITYGEIDVPQALAVATGFVDLVNIPLPSAGKYKITYVVRASITTSGTLAVLALRNGSNTQISGTEAMAVYNLSDVQVTCTQVCVVNPTAAETFKLSAWTQAGSGSLNVINDGNGRSKVLWEKIQ